MGLTNSVNEFDGGVTGLNTGFDSVNDAATGTFRQMEQGFGDSLYAIQDYQISGLTPLAHGYGSQLPTELGYRDRIPI